MGDEADLSGGPPEEVDLEARAGVTGNEIGRAAVEGDPLGVRADVDVLGARVASLDRGARCGARERQDVELRVVEVDLGTRRDHAWEQVAGGAEKDQESPVGGDRDRRPALVRAGRRAGMVVAHQTHGSGGAVPQVDLEPASGIAGDQVRSVARERHLRSVAGDDGLCGLSSQRAARGIQRGAGDQRRDEVLAIEEEDFIARQIDPGDEIRSPAREGHVPSVGSDGAPEVVQEGEARSSLVGQRRIAPRDDADRGRRGRRKNEPRQSETGQSCREGLESDAYDSTLLVVAGVSTDSG